MTSLNGNFLGRNFFFINFLLNDFKFLIFRSNTSILAQKKKNQKKKASRKRALDRRHSEGSENEKHDDEFEEKVRAMNINMRELIFKIFLF